MGRLAEGTPMTWEEYKPYIGKIKKRVLDQFIKLYHITKSRQDSKFTWGDEIEYTLVKFDDQAKKVRVSCRAEDIFKAINKKYMQKAGIWAPECGAFQLESCPQVPFKGYLSCFSEVENNMKNRRKAAEVYLKSDEAILTVNFPSLGAPDFVYPRMEPRNPEKSIFFNEKITSKVFPRFKNNDENVQARRGEKVAINIPVYHDENTPVSYKEDLSQLANEEYTAAAKENHIYLDHRAAGYGCCSIQVTILGSNLKEARRLQDQLTPLAPIIMALSAGTPIFRSTLADLDCRWDAICEASDDRNLEERGVKPLKTAGIRINHRRSECNNYYISPEAEEYNDKVVEYHEEHFKYLIDGGIDEVLAKYIAHLMIRDPLHVYKEDLESEEDGSYSALNDAITSVWNCVRIKVPDLEHDIGWRTEFRPIEIQLTDMENAAYACFIILFSRAVLDLKLSLLLPISLVADNMDRAQNIDAVVEEKFHFRKNIISPKEKAEIKQMTVNEIINGRESGFVGLIPLIYKFLEKEQLDGKSYSKVKNYMDLISRRASGEVQTMARWTRNFVEAHPSYKKDSHVPDDAVYDLMKTMKDITSGIQYDNKLLGEPISSE